MFGIHPHPRRRLGIRLMLGVAVVGSLIAAAVPAQAQHSVAPVTITYWNQWTDPVEKGTVMRLIAAFEKTHPAIRVHEVDISGDQKILTGITGGKPPDAAPIWNGANLGEWAARGAIQNLDPLIKELHIDLSDYTASALSTSTYKGHLYGLPVFEDDYSLYINPILFHAAGLTRYPRTMSELAADGIKLTKKDASGRITQLGLLLPGLSIIYPYFHGQWYDAAHRAVTPDNPGVLQALQWESAYIHKIGVQAYENFVQSPARNAIGDHFIDGHVALAIDGEWIAPLGAAYNRNFHFAVAPPPYADGHPEWANSTVVNGNINLIPTGAAHPKEALEFLQYWGTYQWQLHINGEWGSIPAVKSAGKALAHGYHKLFIDLAQGSHAYAWPVLPIANDYVTQVGAAEDKVIRGKDTAAHAMAQVKQSIQMALMATQ